MSDARTAPAAGRGPRRQMHAERANTTRLMFPRFRSYSTGKDSPATPTIASLTQGWTGSTAQPARRAPIRSQNQAIAAVDGPTSGSGTSAIAIWGGYRYRSAYAWLLYRATVSAKYRG